MLTLESLILILLLIILFLVMVSQAWGMSNMGRHDALLFRFRELQAEVGDYLFDNLHNEELTRDNKVDLRRIVNQLDIITTHFSKAKKKFTYAQVAGVLFAPDSIKASVEKPVENHQMNHIKGRIAKAMLYALTQHLPYLRFQVILRVAIPVWAVLLKTSAYNHLGGRQLRKSERMLRTYKEMAHSVEIYEDMEAIPC